MYFTTTISVSVHSTIEVAPTTSSFVGSLENTDGQRYRGEVPGIHRTLSNSALVTEGMAISYRDIRKGSQHTSSHTPLTCMACSWS